MPISASLLVVFLLLSMFAQQTQENRAHVWLYLKPDANETISDSIDFDTLLEYTAGLYSIDISIDHVVASRDVLGIFFETIDETNERVSFLPPESRDLIAEFPQSPVLFSSYSGYGILLDKTDKSSWDVIAKLTIGLWYYTSGNCEEAIPIIQETQDLALSTRIDIESFNEVSHFYLGNCWIILEQYNQSTRSFESVLASLIKNGTPYIPEGLQVNLAWAYIRNDMLKNAKDVMNNIMDQHQSCLDGGWCNFGQVQRIVDLYKRRARLYAMIADMDAALADLSAALDLLPDNLELYTLRGQMYLNIYEWDKSLADYNTALELAPDYAEAYFQRGLLYYSILQTGQALREEALADFQHYLDLAPDGPHAEEARHYIETIEAAMAALNE